ncbi:MAG: DUF927 domain-containing protein [Methylococcus sp.]
MSKKKEAPASGAKVTKPKYPTNDDFERVKAAALASIGQVLAYWLPDGKERGGEWHCKNPTRDDEHAGNFSVNLTTGKFFDFATGEGGADLIALVHYIEGTGHQSDALARLADFLGIDAIESNPDATGPTTQAPRPRKREAKPKAPEPRPIMPVPPEALASKPTAHPGHGKPSQVWEYRDENGGLLFEIHRYDLAGERKQFAPLTYWPEGWKWKGCPEPRPLYGRDRLAARPDAPVIFPEGEKAADAAGWLMPDHVAITTPNGAQSPAKCDFSPLRGRHVRIWRDHDEAGRQYEEKIAKLAMDAGAASVELLETDFLGFNPVTNEPLDFLPTGWDAADALADGWNPDNLAERLRWKPITPPEPPTPDPAPTGKTKAKAKPDPARPAGFELIPHGGPGRPGVYAVQTKTRTDPETGEKSESIERLWLSGPFTIDALARDSQQNEWARRVSFTDPDGHPHEVNIPNAALSGSGEALRSLLLAHGLPVSTINECRRKLMDYVLFSDPPARARITTKTGWHPSGGFVLPAGTIGPSGGERVIFESELEAPPFQVKGTLGEWQQGPARLAVGNHRLIFGLSAGLAAPLLHFSHDQGFVIHWRGKSTATSSTGKTTLLRLNISLQGAPDLLRYWRQTDNGLESTCESFNDCCLCLDELAQLDPKAAAATAYLIAHGEGKARAGRAGEARPIRRWRVIVQSSGEVSLEHHMADAEKRHRSGMEVRFIELSADAGAGLGMFETLHGYPDAAAFAKALTEAAAANHGAALPAWIRYLIEKRADLPGTIKASRAGFVGRALASVKEAAGTVCRVCDTFALIAVAGELATEAGITGWTPGLALAAAEKLFHEWIADRGGHGSTEEAALIEQVRGFLALHGEARYVDFGRAKREDDHMPKTSNRAGFLKKYRTGLVKDSDEDEPGGPDRCQFLTFPEVFRLEICKGFDYRDAEEILTRAGLLLRGKDGRATQNKSLPGFAVKKRVYVLTTDTAEGNS